MNQENTLDKEKLLLLAGKDMWFKGKQVSEMTKGELILALGEMAEYGEKRVRELKALTQKAEAKLAQELIANYQGEAKGNDTKIIVPKWHLEKIAQSEGEL